MGQKTEPDKVGLGGCRSSRFRPLRRRPPVGWGVCPPVRHGMPGVHPGLLLPGEVGLVVAIRLGEKLFVALLERAVDDGCV